ncbi:uncharacterized protein LOC114965617 [Acropora millepora]|uniref:uncharacterized protein LOC114965617 n=1 Tax=Acropora millepora TaxID=45264 RepID=UPI001CF26BFC|nr:uncharacterized protein LOC114965617 [Acropora millepora]
MGSSAKKEHNKCASSRKKTGGGRQPESPKGTKIIELFEEDPSFSGILGGIDLAQVLDSTINIKDLEPTTEVRRENTTVSCHPPTEETSGQRRVVSHAASRHDTTVPDLPLYPSGSSSQALPSEPSKIPALVLPEQSKKSHNR